MPARRLAPAALAAFALAADGGPSMARAQEPSIEWPVKAAFLYKFGAYVDWPSTALPEATTPLTLCVVGADPFGPTLDRTVQGQTAAGRPIVVRRLATVSPASGCQIAFLGGSPAQSADAAAKAVADAPVLTVTDSRSSSARGVIHFVVAANRVRFAIDQRTAAKAGLSISSKLLNLALEVAR